MNLQKLLNKYPKYQKKVFDSLIAGVETWIHFYEPKRKVKIWIWAWKRTPTAKMLLSQFALEIVNQSCILLFLNVGVFLKASVKMWFLENAKLYEKKYVLKMTPACQVVSWHCSSP